MNFGTIAGSIINLFYSRSPHLSYTENGRSGYIYYKEGFTDIQFYYELGGGDCQLCIDIPAIEKWEKETNTPLSRRDEILHFVGTNVIKDKYTPLRRYEVVDNWLNIY